MRKLIISFLAALAVALTINAPASAASTYVVQPGDTLYLIAQRFQTTTNDIAAANSLHSSTIYPGQALAIPTGGSGASTNIYTVQPGDTLFLIAQKYGVNHLELQKANNLLSTEIYPGQKLTIPTGRTATTPQTSGQTTSYEVQPGDSLYLIGQRYGVSVSELQSLNNLSGTEILVGQYLKIPAKAQRSQQLASRGGFSWREIDLIARVVNGEARGEPYIGQVAVAAVILNRLQNANFPKTVAGVIYQPGAFTACSDGQINAPMTDSALRATRDAIAGWDPTNGALYYWNPVTATSKWVWSRKITQKIGNHVFAI